MPLGNKRKDVLDGIMKGHLLGFPQCMAGAFGISEA